MLRTAVALALFLCCGLGEQTTQERPDHPSYAYEIVRAHELKPHRGNIPMQGVHQGFNSLRLRLIISPSGNVVEAEASGKPEVLKFWPLLQDEVYRWKFTPFEENGKAITAEIEEWINLVPPERIPAKHVAPPDLQANSEVAITLQRTGCFGTCSAYTVTISQEQVVFDGQSDVVASGRHMSRVDADAVRKLAQEFVAADFYSMDASYRAGVTDNPTYTLSIEIDGKRKQVEDYVGSWVGMPATVSDLERKVDELARTQRWISGSDGLVEALTAERFNIKTREAQTILKQAARRAPVSTVRALLDAGVPLEPLPAPKSKESHDASAAQDTGWLDSASGNTEVLQLFIDAGASEKDQRDKDLALAHAANFGQKAAVRALIAYGANPNADLNKLTTEWSAPLK